MQKHIIVVLIFIFGVGLLACAPKNNAADTTANTAPQTAAAKRFAFKGKVVEISDPNKKIVKIAHEEIKDFMAAMTMKFTVKDDANFSQLKVGDELTATLVYNPNDNRSWLENLTIATAAPTQAK